MSTVPDCERGEAGGGHGGRTASEVANARHAFVTAGKLRRHKRWILAQEKSSRAADQALSVWKIFRVMRGGSESLRDDETDS